jgi:chemotaxis protein CheD
MTPSIYLKPGEWFFGQAPAVVETVLGSCVGVVMRNGTGMTAVAHCVLPRWDGVSSPEATGKYVDRCLHEMLWRFERRGIARGDIEVKLFGGANVLASGGARGTLQVGRDNVNAAIAILERAGVRVTACQVGGTRGRKIVVRTGSGEVSMTVLPGLSGGVCPPPALV